MQRIRNKIIDVLNRAEYIGIRKAKVMGVWDLKASPKLQERIEIFWPRTMCDPAVAAKNISEWLKKTEHVGFITCRTRIVDIIKATFPKHQIVHYPIPSEPKCRHLYKGSEDNTTKKHYPHYVNDICERLARDVKPGSLWLVGAGVLKFFYADVIQKKGGVFVDLGCAFDYLDGDKTRVAEIPTTAGRLTVQHFESYTK
jgi:hypothetical protein